MLDFPSFKTLVVCKTYNQSVFITDAMNGFIAQKASFPFVCMIIDDASTDGEESVIKDFLDKEFLMEEAFFSNHELAKIVIAKHKTNHNCTFAVYFLKQNLYYTDKKDLLIDEWRAHCKYEALCEGDDYWTDPDKLQKQVDYLESHDDVSMTFHNAKVIRINPEIEMPSIRKVENREYSASELFENWVVPTASIVFRSTVLQLKIKEPEKILNGDIFLIEQCAHSGKVIGMAEEMSAYRIHTGGVTYDKSMSYSRLIALPDHYECLALNFPDIDRHIIRARLSDAYYNRGRNGKAEDGVNRAQDICKAFTTGRVKLILRILRRKFNMHS